MMHTLLKAVSCMPLGIEVAHVQLKRKGPCLLPRCCCLTSMGFWGFFVVVFFCHRSIPTSLVREKSTLTHALALSPIAQNQGSKNNVKLKSWQHPSPRIFWCLERAIAFIFTCSPVHHQACSSHGYYYC